MASTTSPAGVNRPVRAVMRGFDSISIMPSRRLDQRRNSIFEHQSASYRQAWRGVAVSLSRAADEVRRELDD